MKFSVCYKILIRISLQYRLFSSHISSASVPPPPNPPPSVRGKRDGAPPGRPRGSLPSPASTPASKETPA